MPRREKETPKTVLALLTYVPMLLIALLINSFAGSGSLFYAIPPLAEAKWQLLTAVLIALAIVLPGPFLSRKFNWASDLEQEFKRTLGTMTGGEILALAVLSSVAEEALFRGALQPLLGIVGSSVVFALAHPPLRRELRPWTVFAFVLGLMLGALYAWEPRNILGPIVVHFLINFINLHRINRLKIIPREDPASSDADVAADAPSGEPTPPVPTAATDE